MEKSNFSNHPGFTSNPSEISTKLTPKQEVSKCCEKCKEKCLLQTDGHIIPIECPCHTPSVPESTEMEERLCEDGGGESCWKDRDGFCIMCQRDMKLPPPPSKLEPIEDWEKEEWGGWKIISDMLDNPDENGIYPTSEAYKKLYDFVVSQKTQAIDTTTKQVKLEEKQRLIKEIEGMKKDYLEKFGNTIADEMCDDIINLINQQ